MDIQLGEQVCGGDEEALHTHLCLHACNILQSWHSLCGEHKEHELQA